MDDWEAYLFESWIVGDQGASLPQSWWKVTKGLFYLGTWSDWEAFLSQSWIVGDQWASLPWNLGRLWGFSILILNYGWPRGFSTSILMKDNQRASLPPNLGWLRGLSISILNCGRLRDFSTSILMNGNQGASLPQNLGWFPVKDQNLGLDFKGWVLCCSIVLRCVIFICSFLVWIFLNFSKKTLINCCSPLKKILILKFETWNLKLKT